MKNQNKKILLLGSDGYIGSSLYDYLTNLKYDICNVDLFWFGKMHQNTIQKNYDELTVEFINKFSHIILLAAHSSVAMCSNSLESCFNNNVSNFIRLIEKINNNQTLIYMSSAAVYGNNDKLVDETYPITGGLSFYDYTKICNDNIASLYPNKKIVGLRLGTIGGFSKNFRCENLINSLATASIKSNKMIITNPENYRSVLGMKDLCRSIHAILESDTIKNRIYNITSLNAKIIEFAEKIKNINGGELIVNDSLPTNYSFNCDSSLFQTDYNFKFNDTVETIFVDISKNLHMIVSNLKRTPR